MSSVDAKAFTKSFVDLFKDYKDHPAKFSFQVERLEYGQVKIALIERTLQAVSREIVTPPQFNPVGWIGLVCRSMKREVSASHVLTYLFFKVLGLPCSETQQETEVETLHSVLSAAPVELRVEAAKALEQNMLVYQILDQLQEPPMASCCRQLCEVQAQHSTLHRAGERIDYPDGKVVTQLWTALQPQEDKKAPPQEENMAQTIAETNDDLCFALRAMALGISHELTSPVCRFLEAALPASQPERWSHQFRYEFSLNEDPTVEQHVVSCITVDGAQPPILSIQWTVSIHFDTQMCPVSVHIHLDSTTGIEANMLEELRTQCSGTWQRDFYGNIEALFHRPNLITFMTWRMNEQAKLFHPVADEQIEKGEGVHPNLVALLQSFNIPLSMCVKAFKLEEFDEYLRGTTAPSHILGLLIAVSNLPFDEAVKWIEKSLPQVSARWSHDCSRVDIASTDRKVTVVHHGVSRLTEMAREVGSITWSLTIILSPRGSPSYITFTSSVKGRIEQPKELFFYRFAPPPYPEAFAKLATAICEVPAKGRAPISTKPIVVTMGEERSELYTSRHEQSAVASFAKASPVKRQIAEPPLSVVETYIPIPIHGITFNDERIEGEKGADAIGSILAKLGINPLPSAEAPREAVQQVISSHPRAPLVMALISAFSSVPILPVAEFLHRIRPTRTGETWEHEDRSSMILINEPEKTVLVHRTICSRCIYRYVDLFEQHQSRAMVEIHTELDLVYDLMGQPQSAKVYSPSHYVLDGQQVPLQNGFRGDWRSPPSYAVETVFRVPQALDEIRTDLARMRSPVIIHQEPQSLIRVFDGTGDRAMQFVDPDHSGLEVVMQRLNLPESLLHSCSTNELFDEKSREFERNRRGFADFLNHLKLPVEFPYSTKNEVLFVATVRDSLKQRYEWKKRLEEWKGLQQKSPLKDINALLAEQHRWDELLQGIRIEERDELLDEKVFLERWRQHTDEKEQTNFLFLLGLAGGQVVSACLTNLLEEHPYNVFSDIGTEWRHHHDHLDVHFEDSGDFDIIQRGRSSRIQLKETVDGTDVEEELAWLGWSITMRFDANRELVQTSSSIDEMHAPSLPSQTVKNAISIINSMGEVPHKQETVCPLVSIDDKAYQEKYPSPMQHLARLPMAMAELAMNRETLSFLHHATESSLDLNKIISIIGTAEEAIVNQYAAEHPHVPKQSLSEFHTIQSSIHITETGESKLCHTITTVLYSLDHSKTISHFQKIAMVPWRIDFLLDPSGKPHAVTVVNMAKAFIPESIIRQCQEMLQAAYRFNPLNYSVTVYPNKLMQIDAQIIPSKKRSSIIK